MTFRVALSDEDMLLIEDPKKFKISACIRGVVAMRYLGSEYNGRNPSYGRIPAAALWGEEDGSPCSNLSRSSLPEYN